MFLSEMAASALNRAMALERAGKCDLSSCLVQIAVSSELNYRFSNSVSEHDARSNALAPEAYVVDLQQTR